MSYQYPGHRIQSAQIGRLAHPDSLANYIAQLVVRDIKEKDPNARADISVILNSGIHLSGPIKTRNYPGLPKLGIKILKYVKEVGYGPGY